jgi:hypothetical protein
MIPGRRSAAAELYGASNASPGDKASPDRSEGSQPLFNGPVEWEDIDTEDPMAMAEAQQPTQDGGPDAGPADEEGELDEESADEEEKAAAEPGASVAAVSQPGQVLTGAATQAPTGSDAQAPTTSTGGNAQAPAPAASAKARASKASQTYHVNRAWRDGPYEGTAKYDVRVTAKDITITVGIRLKPGRGVSVFDVAAVIIASQVIFQQKYDGRFKLTEPPYKPRPLRMRISFAHPKPHHDVALHKGAGRDNASKWYVKGDATTRAHEIGHLLGLKDEYEDKTSPDRKVYTDNSLMGNYYAEGIKTASLKRRHGKVFAHDISRTSGRKFYISP